MFIDQFGLGNLMMPVQRYQPFNPGQGNQQRMLTSPGQTAAGAQQMPDPFSSGTAAIASGAPPSAPPATSPTMPPGWSTPPYNPNGTPPPTNPPPTTVSGPVAPGATPDPAAAAASPVEPVTVDEEGRVVGAEQSDFGPGVYRLKEGITAGDRMRAGFMMLSQSGQPGFANVAGQVNAGLNQKQQQADTYNQQLLQMTRPRYEEGEDKDGRILRKTYPAAYEYDPVTSTIREIPGGAAQKPKIEVLYDPTENQGNEDRGTYEDSRGWLRYKDNNSLVEPDAYEEGYPISAEGRLSATRILREEYKSDIKPIEDEINQIDLAVTTAANAYLDPESTAAQKAEADRALVKLVEKLWDPTSAVLGGEFETAQAAQSAIDQAVRTLDLSSGETLGNDKRRALLDILRLVGEEKVGVYNERAGDLSSRASSVVEPYRASQAAGVIDAALPRSWRQDGEGNPAGGYVPRALDPKWQELMSSRWWGARTPTDDDLPPASDDLNEQAKQIIMGRSSSMGGRP